MNRLTKLQEDISPPQPAFTYTTDKGCLTLPQRQFYEENGYIVIRDFLKHEDIDKWITRFR